MHTLVSAAAPHAGQASALDAAIAALAIAAIVVFVVLKVIGKVIEKIFSSPKKASRPAAGPYGTTRR
jgi:uncharacterized membrane protein YoaK (UPF0700 family)